MAIQFHCSSCGKSIEVDDEWANLPVTCPFCRVEVTAPAESTLQGTQIAPSSAPAQGPSHPTVSPAAPGEPELGPPTPQPGALRPNPYGTWGLILSLVALMTLVIAFVIVAKAVSADVRKRLSQAQSGADQERILKEYQQHILQQAQAGRVPPWVGWFSIGLLLGSVFCVAGLALSIVGITRRHARRRPAIAGLIISASMLLGTCCMFGLGLAMRAGVASS